MNARIVTGTMVASLAVFLADGPPTLAGLVTWEFAGEVGHVTDPTGVLGGGVSQGNQLTGSFTFDAATPDAYPDDPHRAFYFGAITEISGTLGQLAFTGPGPSHNQLTVFNDHFIAGDEYGLWAEVDLVGFASNFELTFNGDATMLWDDSLPRTLRP